MSQVLVIGAGPVGAAFALLAARQGLDVALLEAREGPSRESRTLALSQGSREILERAGVDWASLAATEIHTIHSSQKGGFGRVLLSREDAKVPALGYVVSYAALQAGLDAGLQAAGLTVHRGAVVSEIANDGEEVHYQQGGVLHTLHPQALVLADGGANLAKVPAIVVHEKDYGQTAMLGHLECDRPHGNVAYERFTPNGPAALLPSGMGGALFPGLGRYARARGSTHGAKRGRMPRGLSGTFRRARRSLSEPHCQAFFSAQASHCR